MASPANCYPCAGLLAIVSSFNLVRSVFAATNTSEALLKIGALSDKSGNGLRLRTKRWSLAVCLAACKET